MVKTFLLATVLTVGITQPSVIHYVKQPLEIKEIIVGEVSAYTTSVDETDSDNMITASGKIAVGNIIACPDKYPFGTKIKIKENIFVCEDRMADRYRYGNYFDILMETKKEAYNWGRQIIEVEILREGGPEITSAS